MPVSPDSKVKEKAERLHNAYKVFLSAMEDLKKEKKELERDLQKILDQQAMHEVLKKISNLKDN